MKRLALAPVLGLALVGCKRPPAAPAELSELCSYVFEHMGDEDDTDLAAGVENLAAWFADNGLEAPEEGFEVTQIDVDTAYALPDIDLSDLTQEEFEDGLVGAAVVNQHGHSLDDLAYAIVEADQMEVFPDDYQAFERTFLTDVDCFMDGTCVQVDALNYSEASYAGVLNVKSENRAQWRWVDTGTRRALVHRAWLTGPADINPALATIPAEFFTTVTMELDDGTMVRMQTVWFVALLATVEANAFMLNSFVNALSKSGEQVETWLDEGGAVVDTGAPPPPGAYEGGAGSCSAAGAEGGVALALPALLGLALRRRERAR